MEANVDNVADAEQVAKANKFVKFDATMALKDMKELLEIPAFNRFVWRYLGNTRYFELSMTGERLSTEANEGMRSIGKMLFDEVMKAKPQAIVEMFKDSIKRNEK